MLWEHRNNPQSLESLLKDLKQKYHVEFGYSNGEARQYEVQRFEVSGEPLLDVLRTLLLPTPFHVEETEENVYRIDFNPTAAPRSFSGVVYDSVGRKVVPHFKATLVRERPDRSDRDKYERVDEVQGDETGRFSLECHCPRDDMAMYSIVIEHPGYQSRRLPVSNYYKQLSFPLPTFYMGIQEYKLPDVVLSASSQQRVHMIDPIQKKIEVDKDRIEMYDERLRYLGAATQPDPLRSIQLLPGIRSIDGTVSNLSIRGGGADQSLFVFDGITLYQAGHFFGSLGLLNPDAVDHTAVYMGGMEARWDGRLAAAVDFMGAPARQDSQVRASVNLHAMGGGGRLQAPLMQPRDGKHAEILVTGRLASPTLFNGYAPNRWLFDQTFQQGIIYEDKLKQLPLKPQAWFGDATAKAVWQSGENTHFSLTAYAGQDMLDYRGTVQGEVVSRVSSDRLEQRQYGASLSGSHAWTANGMKVESWGEAAFSHYGSSYAYQLDSRADESAYSEFQQQMNRVSQYSIRQENKLKLPAPDDGWLIHNLTLGLSGDYFRAGFSDRLDNAYFPQDTLMVWDMGMTRPALLGAAYGQYVIRTTSGLSLTSGLRYNYYSPTQAAYVSPRIALKYQPDSQSATLVINWGRYHQFMHQLRSANGLQVGESYWMLAGPDSLGVMSADHLSLGGTFELIDTTLLLDATLYYKEMRGVHTYDYAYEPFSGELVRQRILSNGSGRAMGLDVLLRLRRKHFVTWVSYSLGRVTNQFPDIEAGRAFAADVDFRHTLSYVAVLGVGSAQRLQLSGSCFVGTGAPYTAPVGIEAAVSGSGVQNPVLIFGPRNADRLPTQWQVNLSMTYKLMRRGADARPLGKVGCSLNNIFDRRNVLNSRFVGVPAASPQDEPTILRIDRYLMGFQPGLFLEINL
ncbi:MAG: hypothetical protein OHK0039_03830 [Bacteroidia bacterium]